MEKEIIISVPETEKLFKEYCKGNKIKFSTIKFTEFLKFLEIDFYDWVKENMKLFSKQ